MAPAGGIIAAAPRRKTWPELLQRIAPSWRDAFSAKTDRLERVAFGALLVFVAVVALAARRDASLGAALIESFAFLIATATFLSRARMRDPQVPLVPVAAVVLIAALGAVQLLPLPAATSWLEFLRSVRKFTTKRRVLLDLFARGPAPTPRISIAPTETASAIRLDLAYLMLFLASERLLNSRARRRVFAGTLLAAAMLHVGIAVAMQIGEPRLHGTFANPDHFGGYLEAVSAVGFGVLWSEILVNADRAGRDRERAARVENRLLPIAGRVIVWAVVIVGIGLTQSRGAITASALTMVTLLVLGALHPRAHARRSWRGALALTAGIVLAGFIAGRVALVRFVASDARDFRGGTRVELWQTSVEAWREFPWLGSGLGSFADAFRRVQARELNFLVEQAHSDPLQLLVTGGVVGAVSRIRPLRLAVRGAAPELVASETPRGERLSPGRRRGASLAEPARARRVQHVDSGDPGDARVRARHGARGAPLARHAPGALTQEAGHPR